MTTDEFAIPELDLPSTASIRRAVLLGVLRSGFAAAAWLVVAAIVAFFAILGLNAVRTEHFHDIGFYGSNGGGCCSANLGLTNSQDLNLTARGGIGGAAPVVGHVRQSLFGTITADLPPSEGTPIGEALGRDRPPKDGTARFLDSVPPSASVSAVVEFAAPLTRQAYIEFPGAGDEAVLLNDPYGKSRPVSWSIYDLDRFTRWVGTLSADDDETLAGLGAPPVRELRAAAHEPRVHAFVLERATVDEARTLLADPRIRSVNIADVGFDPSRQLPKN
jgi:hypothetical protein